MRQFVQVVYGLCSKMLPQPLMRVVLAVGRRCYFSFRDKRCKLNAGVQSLCMTGVKGGNKWAFDDVEGLSSFHGKWLLSPSADCLSRDRIMYNHSISERLKDALIKKTEPRCEEVAMYELHNVTVASSDPFVCNEEDGIVVALSYGVGRRISPKKKYNHSYFESIRKKSLGHISGLTLDLRSVSGNVFCHWLIEALPRLRYVKIAGYTEAEEMQIIASGDDLEYKKQTLIHAGIDPSRVIWMKDNEVLTCERLITFTPMEIKGCSALATGALQDIFKTETCISRASKWFGKKVFISRQRARFRKIVNYPEAEKILDAAEFEVVFFEDLSASEQLECVFNAKVLLGVHGSAHALIHALPNKHNVVIAEIFPTNYINPLFCHWAFIKGLKYSAFLGNGNVNTELHDVGANVFVDIGAFKKWLSEIA